MNTSSRPLLRNCRAFLLAATFLGVGLQAAPVLPSGGSVVAGSGSVSTAGSTLTVTQQTAKMAVNWDSFSIGEGAAVRFVQPSASSVALNRVTGGDASVIQGSLTSNGQVFLLNPSGVLFSKTAQVSVGGLVASTLSLSNADFLAGNYVFTSPGAGLIANEGSLVAVAGGSISLIAAKVVNDGSITAERGSVNLAAGSRVTLSLGGLVNLTVDQSAIDALVSNGGAIRADGGQVLLTARGAGELAPAAISNAGIIEARTLATGEQGEIRLLGGLTDGDAVAVSGRLDVSAPNGGNGGFIETSASRVTIADSASINALATVGKTGSWLLDPDYINIVATGGVSVSAAQGQATGTSEISVSSLSSALNTADVTLEAINQIDFQVAFSHSGTRDAVLTLLAPTIKLGGDITATGRHLGLTFGNGSTYAGNVFLYNPAGAAVIARTLTTNGGNIVFNGNIGGAHDFVIDAGSGEVRMSATVDGTFTCWQQVYGDLAFRYQAGGRVGDTTTIDFTNSSVSFFDGTITRTANQSDLDAISGHPFSFPTGYLVIPASVIMDLNAQRVPITLTHADGTIDTSLTSANNGQVTFPAVPTSVQKLQFRQTNGSWTEIFAAGISWMSETAAGKLRNLTIKGSKTTIDAGRTISVDGNITVATAKFVNNSGSTALQPGSGKTWQVWSTNPDPFDATTGDVDGDLPFDFKQYGATYGVTTPGQATGNGMFYSYRPNLAATLINTATKVYNGNFASINLVNSNYDVPSGAVDGDVVTFTGTLPSTGTYADKNVGTGINITSSVIPISNIQARSSVATGSKPVYGYGPSSLTATGYIGIITKATISAITGVTAQDRQYNGLLGATLDLSGAGLTGLVGGDVITLSAATGNFGTADVGTNKNVTVNGLTFSASPALLANYNFPTSFIVQASITRAPLTITAANDSKTYDRLAYSGGNGVTYSGFVNGETESVLGGSLTYGGSSQGAVNAGPYAITPGGFTSGNYLISFASGTLTVDKATITGVTGSPGVTARDRQYNGLLGATLNLGTATLLGLIPGDDLSITAGTGNFGTAGVGSNKDVTVNGLTFSGAALANYNLPTSFIVQASITRAPLSVTARNDSRTGGVYGGGNGVIYAGFVNGETYAVLGGTLGYSGNSQGASTTGLYVITPGGLTSGNYQITFVDGQLTFSEVAQPSVDPHEFLPKSLAVPVYPVSTVAVQVPMSVGGLNYVPATEAGVPIVAAPAVSGEEGQPVVGKATDRIDKGASRAIQGPTDVLVIKGGVNLGINPLSAE